jgi:hypothetical protein
MNVWRGGAFVAWRDWHCAFTACSVLSIGILFFACCVDIPNSIRSQWCLCFAMPGHHSIDCCQWFKAVGGVWFTCATPAVIDSVWFVLVTRLNAFALLGRWRP